MKKIFLNRLGFLIILPIILNLVTNFLNNTINLNFINIFDFISSVLIFFFLFSVGYLIKLANKSFTLTFGIILYLTSFFVFETFIYIFTTRIDIHTTFLLVNGLWSVYLFYRLKTKSYILFPIFTFILMRIFNLNQINEISFNKNLIGDVVDVFLPNIIKIYEDNLYISLTNQTYKGYPQFLTYLDALIFKFSFGLDNYMFALSTAFVFYFLFLLLFFETNLSFKNKINASLFFSILIWNSVWLQFLFLTSLMNERFASYFFLGILITIFSSKKIKNSKVVFFVFSYIFITKQFFSVLLLVCFFIFLTKKDYRKNSILMVSSIVLRELYHLTYLKGIQKDHHIAQINMSDTILDILLLRNLEVKNIVRILDNLLIDKPATYLVLLFFAAAVFSIFFNSSNNSFEENIYLIMTIANFLLIFLLYISVWREMELQSPIRYIYSFIPIYVTYIYLNVDKFADKT